MLFIQNKNFTRTCIFFSLCVFPWFPCNEKHFYSRVRQLYEGGHFKYLRAE